MKRLFGPCSHRSHFQLSIIFWGGFAMVVFTAWAMTSQIGDRWGFANAQLKRDVIERWGGHQLFRRHRPSGTPKAGPSLTSCYR